MSASGLRHKAAPRSAKEWSDDDSGAELKTGRREAKRRVAKKVENSAAEHERPRRVTRSQAAGRMQIKAVKPADIALGLTESAGYQGETSSSSDADESPARESAQAPPARSQRRSTRLHNIQKAAKPARGGTRKKPPLPSSPEGTSSEGSESAQEKEVPKRGPVRRPGRRKSKLIQGGGELSSDDYDDEDLNDFIESEQEHADVAAESNEDASADEGKDADEPPSRARRAGQIRKAGVARTRGAAKKAQQRIEETEEDVKPARRRRLLRVGSGVSPEVAGLEDSSSGDEESLAARSARLKGKQPAVPEAPNEDEPGPSAEHARWAPPQRPAQRSAGRGDRDAALAAALADESEQEVEEAEEDLEILGRAAKRRRLRKASGAEVTPGEGAAGPAKCGGMRTRTRTLPTRPSALERLRQHQAALSRGEAVQDDAGELVDGDDGLHDYAGSDDDSSPDKGADFVILEDDEEQEGPRAKAADGSESEESLEDFIEKDVPEETGNIPGSGISSPLVGLGLPYQRPELKESFSLYLDYLVYCLADPDYEAKVDADEQQRRAYLPAVKKIEEEELATWREHYAKSDAWKCAVPGFVPAMERLPGLSVSQGKFDPSLNPHYQEDDDGGVRECAACERLHSRATVELLFKGRPYWPEYKYGTKSLANMAIRADDDDSDLDEEDGEVKERRYVVGQHCAVRVQLYHALWHYKRRMRGKLKKQLKKSRQFLQNVRKPSSWMDAAVNVTEHSRLYNALFYNFQGLKWAAQNYAQAHTGGGYGRAGESVRKTTQKVTKLLYNLNSDSEGDEGSDLDFSDQEEDEDGDGTGTEAEVDRGAEDEAEPGEEQHTEDSAEEEEAEGGEPNEDDFESRQLNSQPVRRRLVLDDSDDDEAADISAEPQGTPSASLPERVAAQGAQENGAFSAGEALAGTGRSEGRSEGAAPVAALAAQSAAGVQAALSRAKTGASAGSNAGAGRSGGPAASSGCVKRQRGILSFFSPKKKVAS
ncbi:hypothetical protein WJX75_006571 [Coccomyxa subellipsoidea]|uniref:DUF4211 domain-containing protein n=1 Tax=Coccomyxa subellipsoidea TaxID=248742 RepID=A0ABR2YXX5_9CHLO